MAFQAERQQQQQQKQQKQNKQESRRGLGLLTRATSAGPPPVRSFVDPPPRSNLSSASEISLSSFPIGRNHRPVAARIRYVLVAITEIPLVETPICTDVVVRSTAYRCQRQKYLSAPHWAGRDLWLSDSSLHLCTSAQQRLCGCLIFMLFATSTDGYTPCTMPLGAPSSRLCLSFFLSFFLSFSLSVVLLPVHGLLISLSS
ncbi:hypothetical protein BO70DRAFT_360843 [Aspergillus heteromorphus CBS 117.55]|uniref:Uncharacterized protein n=1 Tax=Aspergillus heteromorphus CBS 117.55 TaxID=1448321 RepID=A0A317WLV9_9EURO|nr:uncharacterized protein BO70DRAFT_360843 [Aspergillus heteromorphus CBS 117.55]PWY86037.1 hypothetical protein BO70DRAFT_360843 [Aspergillus heteromorphus CBS 117.55]